ncbi:MAG TPA: DUF937 domain-containing protein [Candidatus Dormibacteraeota bacterium]|nr:DUF937 domain-containing protein [Candidatus Dormibacteraeota bacterium]
MTLQDLLDQAEDSGTLDQIAQQLGIDKDVARQGMAQLAPAVARGLQRNAGASGGGLDSLLAMFGGGGQPGQADLGDAILGQIFGSKDVSRNVAGHAASQTGLDSSLLKRMLPLVASAAVMLLSQRARQNAGTAGPGTPGAAPAAQGGSALDILNSLLDQNKDGSAVDDLLNLARKFL